MNITVRRFEKADAGVVSAAVCETVRVSNAKDYPPEYIDVLIAQHSPEVIAERAEQGHMYVACDGDRIIGTGTITGYWGSTTESILLTIFVLPEYQGKGVGRRIIETLEQDEYGKRANRIEIPASLTGVHFYRHLGYDYKDGITEPEDGVMYRLEKRKPVTD
ncbi:MAG: GNAT family N-acetyltransferase [Oscillospiraceae bacterium]|nr:GNAT family N-acetyltransferase [Oscillospiraceae bacterium]